MIGFAVPFGPLDDEEADCGEDYDRATHAIWEYDMGGGNTWQRYPPRIEEALESISRYEYLDFMGELAPKFMYRPGNPNCDGLSERFGLSVNPPPNVATRWVIFEDMFERENILEKYVRCGGMVCVLDRVRQMIKLAPDGIFQGVCN
jgi:hypothetical protein